MSALFVSVAIETAGTTCEHFTDIGDGDHTWKLTNGEHGACVFLRGTVDEVSELAMRIAACVRDYAIDEVERAVTGGA